jgi:GDP-L-fucose synthase
MRRHRRRDPRRRERERCSLLRDPGRAVETRIRSRRLDAGASPADRFSESRSRRRRVRQRLLPGRRQSAVEANITHAAYRTGVEKLLFFGSPCIYPREAPPANPRGGIAHGALGGDHEAYATAKIVGLKLCQFYRRRHGCDFISATPTNLYGPGDNFHPETSHAPAALLRRFHDAKIAVAREVVVERHSAGGSFYMSTIWRTPRRSSFAALFRRFARQYRRWFRCHHAEFAEQIKRCVRFEGRLAYDRSRPDGMPRKLLDSRMWRATTTLEQGLKALLRPAFCRTSGSCAKRSSCTVVLEVSLPVARRDIRFDVPERIARTN